MENKPTLGILGGGQLAKMTAQAAMRLGVRVCFLDRDTVPEGTPTSAWQVTQGDWDDAGTLIDFGRGLDCVILENEFVDADALAEAEAAGVVLRPGSQTVRVIQDKFTQKSALRDAGLPIPEMVEVNHIEDLSGILEHFGAPMVLKQRRDGYDGKGNATVHNLHEARDAFESLSARRQVMAEQYCPFVRELAVMVTRSLTGDSVTYPVVETVQKDHVCHLVRAPADLTSQRALEIRELAVRAVEAFDAVGTVGVELFEQKDGAIVVNEMAPRVHNSGHYTIEACDCSQFENHVRAVLGWPMGSTAMIQPGAVMINLLGTGDGPARPKGWTEALAVPGVSLHIYGKAAARKGRKMGHVTALGETVEEAERLAREAAEQVEFGSVAKENEDE